MVGPLAVFYLALTIFALNCGLSHAFAPSAETCAMQAVGGHPAEAMDHHGHHAQGPVQGDHHAEGKLATALCECLDKLAEHAPVVAAQAVVVVPAADGPTATLPAAPFRLAYGAAAPRAPPA